MCEYPATYMMRSRRARKDHRCCECRGKILKGESYNYHSGVWDGQGRNFKVCPECDLLRKDVHTILKGLPVEDRTVPFEGLLDAIEELRIIPPLAFMINTMEKRGAKIPAWLSKVFGIQT